MKRYNLSEIMNTAHRFNKSGKYSWSECLKKAWEMAKFNVWRAEQIVLLDAEERAAEAKRREEAEKAQIRSIVFHAEMKAQQIIDDAKAKAKRMNDEIAARKAGITINEYYDRLSQSMGYGNGRYMGD